MLTRTCLFLSSAKGLFKLIKYNPKDTLDFKEFINCFLNCLKRAKNVYDAATICNYGRCFIKKWNKLEKLYSKYKTYYDEDDLYKDIFDFNLAKKDEAYSCYMTDIFDSKADTCCFSDAFYEGYYTMSKYKSEYQLIEDDKIKCSLKVSGPTIYVYDETHNLIFNAKVKNYDDIKIITNLTNYELYMNEDAYIEVYDKNYFQSLTNIKELDYENNCLAVLDNDLLVIPNDSIENYKYVVAEVTYFDDIPNKNILNVISYGLALAIKNSIRNSRACCSYLSFKAVGGF